MRPLHELPKQSLPFEISRATSSELEEIAKHRSHAYRKALPEFAKSLATPEPADEPSLSNCLLLARSRLDGAILGSLRMQSNEYSTLPIEGAADIPLWLRGLKISEGTRLAVTGGLVVRAALFKGLLLWSHAHGIVDCVSAARPAVRSLYDSYGFASVLPGDGLVELSYAGGAPHYVLHVGLDEATFRSDPSRYRAANTQWFFDMRHPQIEEVVGFHGFCETQSARPESLC